MVANQSMGSSGKEYKGQLTAALTKVKMDEDKKYILNIPEWKESLKNAFVTFGLSEFLRAEYAIQVPANDVGSILIDEKVEEKLAQMKKDLLTKAKNEQLLKQVTSGSGTVKDEDGTEESKLGRGADAPATAVAMLTTHWPRLEKIVRENALEMDKVDQGMRSTADKQGEHWETLYVDPLTRVRAEDKFLNPRAIVSFGKQQPFWYQVESREMRSLRMLAFEAIKNTLADLPKHVWKHVPVGNVHQLFSLILDNYSDKGRDAVVAKLTERLSNFKKKKSENFVQFVARFNQLATEIGEAGMKVDRDQLANSAEQAILDSEDTALKNVYKAWTMKHEQKMTDPFEAFKGMKASMLLEEKESRARKKKGKDRPDGSETALKAQTGKGRGGPDTNSLVGICQAFQSAKGCSVEDCPFEHRKLSAQEALELKAQIERRRAEKEKFLPKIKCHICGKKGHRKFECPEFGGEQEAVAKVAKTGLDRELSDSELQRLAGLIEDRAKNKG